MFFLDPKDDGLKVMSSQDYIDLRITPKEQVCVRASACSYVFLSLSHLHTGPAHVTRHEQVCLRSERRL